MNHRDGSVSTVDRPKERESNRVVTTERDDSGKGLAGLRWSFLFGVGGRSTSQNRVVAFFDLVESPSVVVSGKHGDQ